MSASDIGQLASEALTALTDPAGVGLEDGDVSGREDYMDERLNRIIAVTDPSDDELETERFADSLDALGSHIERLRERIAGRNAYRPGSDARFGDVSNELTGALDMVDRAVAELREIANDEDHLGCEDCAVNGDDCREHGEALRVARRAALENPDRVLQLLGREDSP